MSSAPRRLPLVPLSFLSPAPAALPSAPPAMHWVGVRARFEQFNRELTLTLPQQVDAWTKRNGVIACLNQHYYGSDCGTDHSLAIGSWAKGTAGRPPRDVDVYFLLPTHVYYRFQNRLWNRQSALLQEVKEVLTETYPETDMTADGQIVLVRFASYNVEVVPAFALTNGRYWICDTNDGGRYKETDPAAELAHIETADKATFRNLRPLVRMAKAWQEACSVPLKSFHLELVAAEFLQQSPWRFYDYFWFDWISRDFFLYLYGRANSFLIVPGTLEWIYLGSDWQTRAEYAYRRAYKACQLEWENRVTEAGEEWQKIFGSQIPRTV